MCEAANDPWYQTVAHCLPPREDAVVLLKVADVDVAVDGNSTDVVECRDATDEADQCKRLTQAWQQVEKRLSLDNT